MTPLVKSNKLYIAHLNIFGFQIDSIFLDFQRAFDTVPHRWLIIKLHAPEITPQLCNQTYDFHSDKKQYSVIDGKSSTRTEASAREVS